jgi:RNA polymerase sigma-70 factor (family 1)
MTNELMPSDPFGDLAERIRGGEERAFRELFDALYDQLLRFAHALVRDAATAEDLVQEAFVRTWDHRNTFVSGQPLRAYLYRTVRNLSLNHLRDDQTRQRLLDDVTIADSGAMPRPMLGPSDHVAALELSAELARLIDTLPPRQREALTLSRIEGLSHDEVAAVMGCAPRTVNNHLVAALSFLRRQLRVGLVASLAWMLT